jgi:hypothetical protein
MIDFAAGTRLPISMDELLDRPWVLFPEPSTSELYLPIDRQNGRFRDELPDNPPEQGRQP